MKYLINNLSIIAGRKFATAYHSNNPWRANFYLGCYIRLRRALPVVITRFDANHMGNHYGSGRKPYRATQGIGWAYKNPIFFLILGFSAAPQKQHPRKYFLNSSCFSPKRWYNIVCSLGFWSVMRWRYLTLTEKHLDTPYTLSRFLHLLVMAYGDLGIVSSSGSPPDAQGGIHFLKWARVTTWVCFQV